ncbi:hypothetical protein BDW74DRAFT_185646 [Aspergillus multicolor]|uniref:oxidase ustYa family protein n=1 Tax=Aspergillus multicolor TaxID=41759 RepID=UPI003CCDF35C
MEKARVLINLWPSSRQSHRFQALKSEAYRGDDDDDHECIVSEALLRTRKRTNRKTKRIPSRPALSMSCICLTTANLAMMSITASVFLSAKMQGIGRSEKNAILRPVSWWSPILEAVEIPSYETKMNGTLFPLPEVSIARQEPGPENDAAWSTYEHIRTVPVTREKILKLGKDPETVARFDDAYWGMGNDAYMVQFDVMHQIHCLDMLRAAAFGSYPGYNSSIFISDRVDKMHWLHLGHCVDILLQNLQCNANTEVLTLAWVDGRREPWPDFSINRKCRDFGAIVKYIAENAVEREKFDKMERPEGAFVYPAPWETQESELGVKLGKHHMQEGGFGSG